MGDVSGWGREGCCDVVDDEIGGVCCDSDDAGDKSGRVVSDDRGGAGSCCELGKDEGLDRAGEGCEYWGWDERLYGDVGRNNSGEDGRENGGSAVGAVVDGRDRDVECPVRFLHLP